MEAAGRREFGPAQKSREVVTVAVSRAKGKTDWCGLRGGGSPPGREVLWETQFCLRLHSSGQMNEMLKYSLRTYTLRHAHRKM